MIWGDILLLNKGCDEGWFSGGLVMNLLFNIWGKVINAGDKDIISSISMTLRKNLFTGVAESGKMMA